MSENYQGPFSRRLGYRAEEAEITIREDAPEGLRFSVLQIACELGMRPSTIRDVMCRVLLTAPNPGNWGEYPNIWDEVNLHVQSCDWFKVYDVAEAIHQALSQRDSDTADQYEERLNDHFRERGIGWQMQSGEIVIRGSESFSAVTEEAGQVLADDNRPTAAREIHEAIEDLSRRPDPDISGAIQHAMAAMECVAREVTGQGNLTLGAIISQHAAAMGIFPPLDQALRKLWGYASQEGRHLQEGQDPRFEEAELVVSVAASVCVYLSKKARDRA